MADHQAENKNCIPTIKQKVIAIANAISPEFDFGTSLERVYPLLQIIFEYLLYEDLKSVALINDVWERYASKEKGKRNKASWITLKRSPYTLIIDKSCNFKYDSVAFVLIFYKYCEVGLNKIVCVHNDPIIQMTFTEYLRTEVIPRDVDFWALSCTGIYPPTLDTAFRFCYVGLLIPEILNISIKKMCVQLNKLDESFRNTFKEDEHIHCILLFTISNPMSIIKKFIKQILNRQSQKSFAFGGGIVTSGIKPFQKDKTPTVINASTVFCIALTQERGTLAMFDSYSAVLKENFEEKLVKFKNSIKLREHSFALNICCAARRNKVAECQIFNKVFPKTFLIGFDTDGEIGWDKFHSWQPEIETPEVKRSKTYPRVTHEYSAIIVLITWGKLNV